MARFQVGMKVYDNEWYLKHNLTYEEAAHCLRDWGVTFVLAQSKVLPMPDSAVKSEVPPEQAERYASYDDRKFRDALARVGIEYYAAVCMFHDPQALEADPSLWPIGKDGRARPKQDWYVGLIPSRQDHVARKVTAIERAVRELHPDGVFLAFIRWPGFWETWTPGHTWNDFPEYSYDEHSLKRFALEKDLKLPTLEPVEAAQWIERNARQAWTDWKCGVIVDIVHQVRSACSAIKRGTKIMLNTLPLRRQDWNDAVEAVYGQRLEALSDVVDVFEVMAYHQILKQDKNWIAAVAEDAKKRTGRTVVCTLQARALYLDGMHAQERRAANITLEEFSQNVDTLEASSADGIVVFTWSDFLEQVIRGKDSRRIEAIRAAAARRAEMKAASGGQTGGA
jgi:hypothetical protein